MAVMGSVSDAFGTSDVATSAVASGVAGPPAGIFTSANMTSAQSGIPAAPVARKTENVVGALTRRDVVVAAAVMNGPNVTVASCDAVSASSRTVVPTGA